ncbi:MAG: tetratricopeptide repeat protein [Candidatus Gastranaerophilales bacterium]|nr:tetratricopeptide repeat protein [Candidatus Gastranaerophilales bacterium]
MPNQRTLGNFTDINEFKNTKKLLYLAKKSHENYLLKSQEADLQNAIDYYIQAMKIAPHISEPYYKLAILLYTKNQISVEQGIEQCRKAIMLSPSCPKARLFYGYFLNLAGYHAQARYEFLRAIKSNLFTSSPARIALALSLLEGIRNGELSFNKFLNAIYYLFSGSVLTLFDMPTLNLFYRSFICNLSVFYYNVKGFFLKQVKKYDLATQNYECAAKNTPKTEQFYIKAGDTAFKAKDTNHAIQSYKKALEYNPYNTQIILKLATIMQNYCENKEDELIECYTNLLKADPCNARICYELGNLYIRVDDRFSALNSFKRAVDIEPNNPFYRNSLAYTYIQLKHYDEALVQYKKAINLNPDNKWTSIVCQAQGAIYYQVKENYEAAITAYEAATVLDKENYDAFYSLGEIYHEKERFDNAIENYCLSLKIQETPKAYCALGIALWQIDKTEESIIAFEQCLYLDSENSDAYNNLGTIYLDSCGEVEKAMVFFSKAVEYNPSDTIAYYNLGRVYQILQEPDLAAKNYQMAIDLNKITDKLDQNEIEQRLYSIFE